MKKRTIYSFFLFLLITTFSFANNNIKIYYEKNKNGYSIYVDNKEYCPITVKIHFELNNLEIQGENDQLYIVAPLKEKQLLTNLSIQNKKITYKFNYTYRTNLGNHNLDEYDSEFIYDLPFPSANTFKINQGYNGNRSHKNQNALDFDMPEGTEIKAVRDGIVVKVIDTNSMNCSEEDCKKYNNEIIIYHPDGTFAEYTHIKKDGSIVKIGDPVKKGDIIGYSGNVGWSTGPHLHLVIFLQKLENRKTIQTKFKIGNGEYSEYLEEKCKYDRNY